MSWLLISRVTAWHGCVALALGLLRRSLHPASPIERDAARRPSRLRRTSSLPTWTVPDRPGDRSDDAPLTRVRRPLTVHVVPRTLGRSHC